MKKLLFILFFLPVAAFSQVDSGETKINVTLQARDIKYITFYTAFNSQFEDLFDNAKIKFRVETIPGNQDNVLIDTVPTAQWLKLYYIVKNDGIASSRGIITRLRSALEAVNYSYLTNQLLENDVADDQLIADRRKHGEFLLTKKR